VLSPKIQLDVSPSSREQATPNQPKARAEATDGRVDLRQSVTRGGGLKVSSAVGAPAPTLPFSTFPNGNGGRSLSRP
jgi:hypothetical protein